MSISTQTWSRIQFFTVFILYLQTTEFPWRYSWRGSLHHINSGRTGSLLMLQRTEQRENGSGVGQSAGTQQDFYVLSLLRRLRNATIIQPVFQDFFSVAAFLWTSRWGFLRWAKRKATEVEELIVDFSHSLVPFQLVGNIFNEEHQQGSKSEFLLGVWFLWWAGLIDLKVLKSNISVKEGCHPPIRGQRKGAARSMFRQKPD